MDIFVARQPILDRKQQVVAYELLFRDGPENFFPRVDFDHASTRVIHDSLNVFGLESLASKKKVFINVTREVLLGDLIRILPPKMTGVEILETVDPDEEVIAKCKELRKSGYSVVLDDFVFRPGYELLVSVADIIKIDFLITKGDERRDIVKRFASPKLRFLAEKVETREEFDEALKLGYTLFQGYFFCKPQMVSTRGIPAFKLNYLRLLTAVNERTFDLDKIEAIIKQEISLSVKLLRYLNSAIFGWRYKVTSIKHALVLLGERTFRQWVSLVSVIGLGDDRPNEIVVTSLVRARFCEQLASKVGLGGHDFDLFLVGMLSLVDALVGRPLPDMLPGLGVAPEVEQALLEGSGPLARVLSLVTAYEQGAWPTVSGLAVALSIDEKSVPEMYRQSVEWTGKIFETTTI